MNGVTCMAKTIVATVSVALLLMSSLAFSNDTEILPGMVVVSDPKLAKMRGKYVASTSQVVYFGVQMQSNWETPNGALLNAGATVAVNMTNSTPTVTFQPTASIVVNDNGTELTDTSGRSATSSGIDNISGVTQSIQSSGDFNSTSNLTRINFLSEIPLEDALNGDINSASFEYDSNGTTMSGHSTLDDNSAVVHLEVDGQGVAEQSIRGSIQGATGKGVYQTIVTLGDRHRITNQLEMDVVLRSESEQFVQQQGLGSAIGNLRGLIPGN